MCVLAHPDDESLGTGGTLAKYAADGVETYLLTATRGERGRFFNNGHVRPHDAVVGRTREAELRAAANELGVREVTVLGYPDGGLDTVPPEIAQQAIAEHLCRIRPHVVITFGPDGAYGHPDHIAISQLTTAAVMRTASPEAVVSKLYYLAWSAATWAAYQSVLK
jgi:LmbE family N-acetylglucosaminyl deacetylase